jgi:predicted protein tyrosine phosphatase
MILVSALDHAPNLVAAHRPERSLSLLSPSQLSGFDPDWLPAERLILSFHDIAAEADGQVAPDETAVRQIIGFGQGCEVGRPVLVHCWMGVSRSPAAAYLIACARSPGAERRIARDLRRRAPTATPNRRMVALADDLLGRRGRMVDAIAAIGRGRDVDGVVPPFTLPIAW